MAEQLVQVPEDNSEQPEQSKQQENIFSSPSTTSDVVLVVEGRKLHVSKSVLALASPVFDRMFYGEFKEKNSSEVQLPDKKYDEMVEFLQFIYPATFMPIDRENVEAMMMLADEYQVQRLLDNCISYLTGKTDVNKDFNPNVSEMIHILHLSENNDNLKEVYNHYLDLVARKHRFTQKRKVDEFNEISLETRYKVVLKRVKLADSNYSMTF